MDVLLLNSMCKTSMALFPEYNKTDVQYFPDLMIIFKFVYDKDYTFETENQNNLSRKYVT